jgi:hypothetical protein
MSVSGRSGEAMRRRTVRRSTSSGGPMGRRLVWDPAMRDGSRPYPVRSLDT